ncbi:MAG TPA: STAS domain-containing protein [Bacteroidales bacterium]|nr:STAS domain-containing protein [Bacteroidales bacterium]HPT10389.1 STAS domain-containing protein [Bacteroidales bacterium]
MEITTDELLRCIRITGRLDAAGSMLLDQTVAALPMNGQDMILDLSACHYLSSAGIRSLLKAHKAMHSNQAKLYITGVTADVLHVLEIAGLLRGFNLEPDLEEALKKIRSGKGTKTAPTTFAVSDETWSYHPLSEGDHEGQRITTPRVMSFGELGFAIGYGFLPGTPDKKDTPPDLFAILGNCGGFLPGDPSDDADFRIASDPFRTGMPVLEALCFGHHPSGTLHCPQPGKVAWARLLQVVKTLHREILPGRREILLVISDDNENSPSVTTVLIPDQGLDNGTFLSTPFAQVKFLPGITFRLADRSVKSSLIPLRELLSQLTIDNITGVEPPDPETVFENPTLWVFGPEKFTDSPDKTVKVSTRDGAPFESVKAFLTRLLYTDSSSVIVDPLHGGYSAQTFRVSSFDHEGRKMRPTVLKMAHRDLITRESERCKQFALPFIFNNSAVVLGAEFYGNTGALRYNFVGIGGESSQLKWLTHYYLTTEISFLEPLFDKIFLSILQPWYGQPVTKTILPFKDHDPTFTFFAGIYQIAKETLDIGPEEQSITIPEINHPFLNPYWYLKNEFARRREEQMIYYTGICHGDLNMQNILLDETMNVYLIDFSETKPRSIISDFARLEAIFLIDNAPVETPADWNDYLGFLRHFYEPLRLDVFPEVIYHGRHREKVMKNATLALKMREYALRSAKNDPNPVPYYFALLEWVLPVVCYTSLPLPNKKISMIVSSLLCQKLLDRDSLPD